MNKLLLASCVGVLWLTSCTKSAPETLEPSPEGLLTVTELDNLIRRQMVSSGSFEWTSQPERVIWSALSHADHMLSVGYRSEPGQSVDDRLHLIDIQEASWVESRNRLVSQILMLERQLDPTLTEDRLMPWKEDVLPVVDVLVRNPATLKWLLSDPYVRYAEPLGYEPRDVLVDAPASRENAVSSSSGCGSNTAAGDLVAGSDYVSVLPSAKQSWNYNYHKIPSAWGKTTGAGIKVFIIDTGCEFDQENLGSGFNQGYSTGRTVEKIVTLPRSTFLGIPTGPVETPDDGCGHGTAMAGACVAPRGTDGNACGVAYNANLVTCRAAEDVFIDDSREAKGVSDAYTQAANRADVRIISMSMGRITSSSQIRDAIRYASGKGKLMFCAAGTSFSWTTWYGVIFPATLTEVNAVTGVRDNNNSNLCSSCHGGSETDFTVVMEKATSGLNALTLAMSGDQPSVVGGSSVATATMAGIAALAWSRFPALTRDQLLNKLIMSSSYYPTRNSNLGWGMTNAELATN